MLNASWIPYQLVFRQPAGTSRGLLHTKPSWFLRIVDTDEPQHVGIGEVSVIPGLSRDAISEIEKTLDEVCVHINQTAILAQKLEKDFPSIVFALETALLDLKTGGKRVLYKNSFTEGKCGIPINGLVWMGNFEEMKARMTQKIDEGFRVIKMKVGAIDFKQELALLAYIRRHFSSDVLTLRLDANGAFRPEQAFDRLQQLSEFDIHSIEQPIAADQAEVMAELCQKSPIPIALDEELIGDFNLSEKNQLLERIQPQYIILKPSLIGGFNAADAWINVAEKLKIGWWATSALESNIGLNAIAQWTVQKQVSLPQGLGTGLLYANNLPSPLEIRDAQLFYNPNKTWMLNPVL